MFLEKEQLNFLLKVLERLDVNLVNHPLLILIHDFLPLVN
tara:strand:+ start:341 stop:460 length:120 start_codon:yes stop_codon:yes gene_type:complete